MSCRGNEDIDIKRVGSQPSAKGPSEWFTGTVRIDPLFQAPDPALVQGASVTFEPGARTACHTHPLGQTLIVTAGSGWAQRESGPSRRSAPVMTPAHLTTPLAASRLDRFVGRAPATRGRTARA